MNNKMICFDMDGTIANLYNVPDWLDKIYREDPNLYLEAEPMWDMEELRKVLLALIDAGWQIRVISWLAKNSSKAYQEAVQLAKKAWLRKYNFPAEKVHLVAYGATKADCVSRETASAILIDDDQEVRNGWHLGEVINPQAVNLIEELKKLLDKA